MQYPSRPIVLLYIVLFSLVAACQSGDGKSNGSRRALTVAAASNVQYAMEALVRDFEASRGINVDLIISSSGKLAAQIGQGAPYHIFVSADEKYPRVLAEKGLAGGQPRIYALGALVLWTVRDDLDLSAGLPVLKNPGSFKIAVANPDLAPYGEQSIKVLAHAGYLEALRSRLVYGENISQTSQYILSGACDLGFTAKSIVLAPELKGKGVWVDVPREAYRPIAQAAVITRLGKQQKAEESAVFFEYLFSEKAKAILKEYGYTF